MTHFNWTPGIGDPTIGGWVTVALYLLASGSCWISAQKLGLEEVPRSNERRAWRAMSVLLLVLGIIKQLNLLTALTAAGRVLARNQGWYEQRQFVQLVFIAVAAMTCLIAAITLLLWARNSPIPTRIAAWSFLQVNGAKLCTIDIEIGPCQNRARGDGPGESSANRRGGVALVHRATP